MTGSNVLHRHFIILNITTDRQTPPPERNVLSCIKKHFYGTVILPSRICPIKPGFTDFVAWFFFLNKKHFFFCVNVKTSCFIRFTILDTF